MKKMLLFFVLIAMSYKVFAETSDFIKPGECMPLSKLEITEASRGAKEAVSFVARVSHKGFTPTALIEFTKWKKEWPKNQSKIQVCYVETNHLNFGLGSIDLWQEESFYKVNSKKPSNSNEIESKSPENDDLSGIWWLLKASTTCKLANSVEVEGSQFDLSPSTVLKLGNNCFIDNSKIPKQIQITAPKQVLVIDCQNDPTIKKLFMYFRTKELCEMAIIKRDKPTPPIKEQETSDDKKSKSYFTTTYKMDFCSNPDVEWHFFASMGSGWVDDKCLYTIGDGSFTVVQVLSDGILATPRIQTEETIGQIIFIKTKKQYVDNQVLMNQVVKSAGIKKYPTVLGVEKTIHAFQYLGDADLKYDGSSQAYVFPQENSLK